MYKMNTYKYYLPNYVGSEDEPYKFTGFAAWDSENLAEDAANDFYHNHDGWKDKWPLTFCVLFEGEWIMHKVDREMEPNFRVI